MKRLAFIVFFLIHCAGLNAQASISSAGLGMMQARSIGPAVMGGRITAIEAVSDDPRVIYTGTAGGGIWKSTDGGASWKAIFDKHCQSIGALAIDPQNREVIWAGTGESNMRNTVSVGDGIFRSKDGGQNWERMGLRETEHISKIIIDPSNSDVIYVAVPGHLWDDHQERGLFKSSDGGKTWKKILYKDAATGCADIAIDPSNPQTLYASMWQFRRKPFAFSSGGKSSGLFKSTDGGLSWIELRNGFPSGDLGRIVITVSPSKPDHLLSIVEAKDKAGLYISDDAGKSWIAQSATSNVTARPFYFSSLVVDPKDHNRVYRPAFSLSISDDGGYSFTEAGSRGGWVHSDHHALWINPSNTSHMYLGTDGGVYMSLDKGNSWLFLNYLPVSQLYHAAYDMQTPYNLYCGLQDNGSWKAPSVNPGGIQNGDWKNVGGGDGFWVQPDLSNPDILYSEYQGGHISRVNVKTNEYQDIQPKQGKSDPKLRFNWNTPILMGLKNKSVVYTAAQFLYKSLDRGITWQRISPDLTTNDPAKQKQEESGGLTVDNSSAENHCTIYTIAISPFSDDFIWIGTDDGNLQYTTDGGANWNKISTDALKAAGIPGGTWITSIEPDHFDRNKLYVTFDNHTYGDKKTYAAMSGDLGKSCTLFNVQEAESFANVIRQDPVNQDLLFLGTEWGLFCSIDAGKNWAKMKSEIPEYAMVRDLQIHPRDHDLIIATHGRGILIVDDITPLRKLNVSILNAEAAFIQGRPCVVTNGRLGGSWPLSGSFVGQNRTEECVITYYLKNRIMTGEVSIEVLDKEGNLINSFPGTKRKGINKINWNMRRKPPRTAEGGARLDFGGFIGPLVPAGTYTIKLKYAGKEIAAAVELIEDPSGTHSASDRESYYSTVMQLYKMQEDLADLVAKINLLNKQLDNGIADLQWKSVKKVALAFRDSLQTLRKSLIATKEGTAITGEEQLREKLTDIYAGVAGFDGRPTQSQFLGMIALDTELKKALIKFNGLTAQFSAAINKKLPEGKGISLP